MDSHRKALTIVTSISMVLSSLTVLRRVYFRVKLRQLNLDDWLMTVALICMLACSGSVLLGVEHGFGRHIWDIPDLEDKANAIKYVLIAPCFAVASRFLVKWSILEGFWRILGLTASKQWKLISYCLLLLLLVGSGAAIASIFSFCDPIRKTSSPALGSCRSPDLLLGLGYAVIAYDSLLDIGSIWFIVHHFCKLHMSLEKRTWACCRMGGGSAIAIITCFLKILYMLHIYEDGDITHAWWPITLCYLIENHVYIIATSSFAFRCLKHKSGEVKFSESSLRLPQWPASNTRRFSDDDSMAYMLDQVHKRGLDEFKHTQRLSTYMTYDAASVDGSDSPYPVRAKSAHLV